MLAPPAASGQSIDELNSRISSAQAEASALGAQIDQNAAALAAAQSEAAAAAQREAELSALLAEGQAREAELERQVTLTQAELERARARLRAARELLADRLVEIYMGSEPDAAAILLSADGFDDLVTRAELLQRIQQADQELAARVAELRARVEAKLVAVEAAEQEAEDYNAEIAAAREQIAAVRAQAEAKAAAAAEAQATQQAALETLRSNVSTWAVQVQEAREAAAERAAAEAAAAEAAAAEQAAAEQAAAEQAATDASAQQEVADWVGDWAIPESIVMCESGGSFGAVNPSSGAGGAYQILPSTWDMYGGEGNPEDGSPAEQSAIAEQIWADSGSSAWVCAG